MNQNQDTNRKEPNSGKETEVPAKELLEADVPLFLRDGSEARKGDAQDEKDKTEE